MMQPKFRKQNRQRTGSLLIIRKREKKTGRLFCRQERRIEMGTKKRERRLQFDSGFEGEADQGFVQTIMLDDMPRILREHPLPKWSEQTASENMVYQTGDLIIDSYANIVFKNGQMLVITPTEFRLLLALVDNSTIFCSRTWLISILSRRLRHVINDNTLSKHVCRLRKKLGSDGDEYILTQNRKGYKWNMVVFRRYISREACTMNESPEDGVRPVKSRPDSSY